MTATGPEGTAWSCVRGGAAGGEGQGVPQRAVGMEQPAQGSGHSPELLEFKECLDNTLRHRVWILDGPVWSQELDSVFLVGLFQFRIFYVSMVL